MYHVAGTSITALLLYFLSFFFFRAGFYSLSYHRKVWNIILALTFILTALAGVFLALQTTYKWEIPLAKTILKWHVEFGIGMAMTGIFHFIWHLSYFRKLFIKPEISVGEIIPERPVSNDLVTNLFLVGFISTSIQLLLLKEIMNIAGGYELIAGIFLGSWLVLSAFGASIAGQSLLKNLKKINLVFSLSPLVSLILLFLLSRLYLNAGESPSFLTGIIFTLIVLSPFCIVSAFTFVKLISEAGEHNGTLAGSSFSVETAGGIVSGIVISILSAGVLNTYQSILLIISLSVTYALTTFYISNRLLKTSFKVIVLVISSLLIIFNPDIILRRFLLPAIHVTDSKDTPYGNISRGIYNGELSIYYNHRLLSFNNDVTESEEDIHYAMLQSSSPERVLLISGSLHSHLPEILKYDVKKITFIERDPYLTSIYKSNYSDFTDKLLIENEDAFSYMKSPGELSDVIILLVPPPSTLLLNRYYTTEFFRSVKKRLKPDGVFMCSPGAGNNYLNSESINLYSTIYNSLGAVFKNVKPVSGNKLYLISSDKVLSVSFCALTEARKIKNKYVCSDYLSDDLINLKTDEVIKLIDKGIKQNTATFPIACLHLQSFFLSRNINEKIPAVIFLIFIFALPSLFIKRRNMIMYSCASSLAGFEIIILLTLQIVVGNMYQLAGLTIAGIMTGLAAGAGIEIGFLRKVSFSFKGLLIMAYYIVFGLFYNTIANLKSGYLSLLIILLSGFLPALLTGHVFRELSRKPDGVKYISEIYSSDLAGSAFGFILVTTVAVPAFGIQTSLYLLSILIFAGIIFGTIRNK